MLYVLLQRTSAVLLSLALVLSVLCAPLHAQQTPPKHDGWYKVEIIIFAKNDYQGMEQFPTNIQLTYPSNWLEFIDPTQAATINAADAAKAVYLLTEKDLELHSQAQKFARSSRYKLLFHRAWRQYITSKEKSSGLLINAGQQYDQHHELEGSITLSVATYLQLKTNLWLTQFEPYKHEDIIAPQEALETQTPNIPQWPKLPTPPNILATQAAQLAAGVPLALEPEQQFMPKRIVLMQEERDMRSNEVHYIDHPVLGIVIKIRPTGL
jgi:Peptidoglycan-binding protein, CsiV